MDQDIVVCEPLRTPIGAFGGQFRDIPAHELSATVVRELMSRTGLDPELVADVLLGQRLRHTSEAPCIGRVVRPRRGTARDHGSRSSQVDRRCGSGLQAVGDAYAMVVGCRVRRLS
jgi:acetyl-CoA C-acetyltransferase